MSHAITEAIWRLDDGPDGIRTLWFDQPGRTQNVLDEAALDDLEVRLVEIQAADSIRGLVIRSAKQAGFCAGAHLRRILELSAPSDVEAFVRRGHAVLDLLSGLTVPTLAVIHGVCFGGGLELALACRRRVALASDAPIQLGMPEVHFGLIPAWGGISRIPQITGPEDGLNFLISGRTMGYLLARSHGIVDRLASEGDSIESLDLLSAEPVTQRSWPKEAWEEAWNRAREVVDEQPGEHAEAQLQILAIVAIELAHGPEAAREATVKALAEMVPSEDVRDGLTALFARGEDPQA